MIVQVGKQRALEQLRRERAEQKDAELRRVRDLMKEDQQVQETAAAIPEKVAQRMGKRMLPFVGIPLFGGMGSFVAFWYLATYKDMEFEPVTVAVVTIGVLVVGLLVRKMKETMSVVISLFAYCLSLAFGLS